MPLGEGAPAAPRKKRGTAGQGGPQPHCSRPDGGEPARNHPQKRPRVPELSSPMAGRATPKAGTNAWLTRLTRGRRPCPPLSSQCCQPAASASRRWEVLYKVRAIASRLPRMRNSRELSMAVRGRLRCPGGRLRGRTPLRRRLSHRASPDPAPPAAPNCFQGICAGRCVRRAAVRSRTTMVRDSACPGWGLGTGRSTPPVQAPGTRARAPVGAQAAAAHPE